MFKNYFKNIPTIPHFIFKIVNNLKRFLQVLNSLDEYVTSNSGSVSCALKCTCCLCRCPQLVAPPRPMAAPLAIRCGPPLMSAAFNIETPEPSQEKPRPNTKKIERKKSKKPIGSKYNHTHTATLTPKSLFIC